MPGAEPRVLALDLGTSSFRSRAFDWQLETLTPIHQSVPRTTTESSLNVSTWTRRAERLVDSTVQGLPNGVPIAAVGTSCFWHSLVGVDAAGEPTTPLLLWSDLRAAGDAATLRRELDERAVHARTGAALHPTFWPARLRWLERSDPEAFRRTARWLSFADYLQERWTGVQRTSLSMASATGLLDQDRLTWDEGVVAASGIQPVSLPPLADQSAPSPRLLPEYARRWPQLVDADWLPAVGDGACSNLGVGAVGPGRWAITVGTTAAIRTVLDTSPPTLPWGLWRYRLDARRVVIGGALNNGGNVYAWLRNTLQLPPQALLERELLTRPWGSHGLTVDPSLAGERSPHWPLDATAAICGITSRTTAVDIAQAMLEAVATRIGELARLLETATGVPESIIATGGAMDRSPAWTTMLQTALGHPITPALSQESSLRGAAMLATAGVMRDA